MEVFCDGAVISLDDYKSLSVVGARHPGWSASVAEKGQYEELVALAQGLRDGRWPIGLEEQLATTRLSFAVQAQLMERLPVVPA